MHQVHSSACSNCGEQLKPLQLIDLPVEPLFDMKVAVLLIPMPYESLRKFLAQHPDKFPKRYRLEGRGHRKIRLISAGEIQFVRDMSLRGEGPRITPLTAMKALGS